MNGALNNKNRDFYLGIILNIFEGLLSGSNSFLIFIVFTLVFDNRLNLKSVLVVTALVAGVLLLRLLCYASGYVKMQIGGAAISKAARLKLGDKLKNIPLSNLSEIKTGEYLNIVSGDVNNYQKVLTHKVGDIAKNSSLTLMLLLFVGKIYFPAALILTFATIILFLSIAILTIAVKKYGGRKNKIQATAVSAMVEYTNGIQTLRAYGITGEKNIKIRDKMKAYSDISYIYEVKLMPIAFVRNIISWGTLPAIMVIAYKPWFLGELTSPIYFMICLMPIYLSKLAWVLFTDCLSFRNLMISKNKINRLMKTQEESIGVETFPSESTDISFENVHFSYTKDKQVLKGLNFTIDQNKLTAVVGDSGSGKSTILNLIAKYYEADSGNIKIGGKNIKDISSKQVLDKIAMVYQEVFLFNATIRENIRYACPNATDSEVEEACKAANCEDFILKLPKGYETEIGENGKLLSGGERQRLSVARAILKNSPIILLDEATSSLDIENELAVKEAIVKLLEQEKTVIMIAHTLSIIKNADKILVVSDGSIKEYGTHDELIEKNGKYAKMWNAERLISS